MELPAVAESRDSGAARVPPRVAGTFGVGSLSFKRTRSGYDSGMDDYGKEAVTPDEKREVHLAESARIERWWNDLHAVDRYMVGAAVALCGVVMGAVMGTAS
jgi:hypothetical protein